MTSADRPPSRAVFLDRDGVLNTACVRAGKPFPPQTVAELEIAADAPASLRRLREAGYLLIVVTNQPDLARGTQTRDAIEQIHTALRAALPLDAIYVCDHDDPDACDCRKPKPGMLLAAARDFGIDLSRSFMIGDRWRDIDAGAQAGCRTIFLDCGYLERKPDSAPACVVPSLGDAVEWILHTDTVSLHPRHRPEA